MQRSPADPRDLISAATPLPWFRQATLLHGPDHGGIDIGPLRGEIYDEPDAALIVYSVNNLPALLDVADALERLMAFNSQHSTRCAAPLFGTPTKCDCGMVGARNDARKALARLQESRDD